MAEQNPTTSNNDKFTLTLKDGATHPTNILASPQNRENSTITQNTPTSPTLPHTQDDAIIIAEAAPQSLSITPDETVAPQDTTLILPSTAHDATGSSMTPPTAFTSNSDRANTTANFNQASKDLSQLPDSGARTAFAQQTRSHNDSGNMEAFSFVHEGRAYEVSERRQNREKARFQFANLRSKLENAKDEISTLEQKLEKAEIKITGLNQEPDTGKTEIANLKQKIKDQTKENSDLKRTADTVADEKSSLKRRVLELDSKNQSLEQEQKRLKIELEKQKDQRLGKNDEMEGLEATVQEQKQSIELQNVYLKKLQQEVLEKDGSIMYANEENIRLVKEAKTMQQKLRTQTGQVKGEAKKSAEAQREIKELKKDHDKAMKELQQNIERLTMRLQTQPKTKLNEMKQEFAETLETNAQMEIDIEILRTEMSGLEQELKKVQARADKAQEKLKAQGSNNKDTKKAEMAGEKVETPNENPVAQGDGAKDVPTVEHLAISVSNEPAVTVSEKAKVPGPEAEGEQESKAEIPELTGPQWESGHTSVAAEAGTVTDAIALESAEDPHKQDSQAVDPFTEAYVSEEHPAASRDKEHDDSSSSVCSATELSIDNRTPRALRRSLGQEGIHSRGQSTATDFSVIKCKEWIHWTTHYVENSMQTDSVILVGEKGVQTENVPVKLQNGEELSAEHDQDPGLEKGSEPKMKDEIPKIRQIRWCCNIPSFLVLLMLLFYLGICYLAWSSWSATKAERNLWTSANNALTHRALLNDNGSWPPSALSPEFANYRKM